MGKQSSPPVVQQAPDYSGQNAAALQQAALSAEQLAWSKQIYAETAPDRANATARANAVSDAQLAAMQDQSALTNEYADYQRNTFQPLEKGIVADAVAYDTPDRRNAESAKAVAGVEQTIAAQQGIANRNLERSGVVPGSGKMLAMQGAMNVEAANQKVGAATRAVNQVETVGTAKRMDAANLGRNLASSQATSAGIALNQGNSSTQNAMQSGNIASQGAGLMNSGYAGAQNGYAGAANTYAGINSSMNAFNANAIRASQSGDNSASMWGALGSLGGAGISAYGATTAATTAASIAV